MSATPKRLRPRREPAQDRSRRTRDRILDAAARVFVAHGYAGGTTNRIAEEAGLSIGSLYQYYPNKDAILLELVSAHVDEGGRRLQALLSDREALPDTREGRVRALVRAAIDLHRGDPDLHRVIFEESPRPAALLERLHQLEAGLVEMAATVLAEDATVPAPDRRRAAWLAATTIESVVHRALGSRVEGIDPDAVEDDLVAMVVGFLDGAVHDRQRTRRG